MKIGYARVSTLDQSLDLQLQAAHQRARQGTQGPQEVLGRRLQEIERWTQAAFGAARVERAKRTDPL